MTLVFNTIFPVFAILFLGGALRRFRLIGSPFLETSDRLVYYIFFPAMLFWKIGAPRTEVDADWRLSAAVLAAVFAVHLLSLALVRLKRIPPYRAGTFVQSCYRFNSYIGMAVVLNAVGESGVREFAVMIGVVIPFINVLAVSTLIWYGQERYAGGQKVRMVARALISNPLILGCAAGMLYSRLEMPLPLFLENTFRLLSSITLPMALISIGGTLAGQGFSGNFSDALAATLVKGIAMPLIGICTLSLFHVSAFGIQVGMIYFALPTSSAVHILSSQLQSDVHLATETVALSTVFAFGSLSTVMFLMA